MKVRTHVDFAFSAAVRMPNEAGAGKRMHGHNYRMQLVVDGETDEAGLRAVVHEAALERCDHHTLNDFIADPTPGNVAKWVFQQVKAKVPALVEVALWRTAEHCVRVSSD